MARHHTRGRVPLKEHVPIDPPAAFDDAPTVVAPPEPEECGPAEVNVPTEITWGPLAPSEQEQEDLVRRMNRRASNVAMEFPVATIIRPNGTMIRATLHEQACVGQLTSASVSLWECELDA